MEKTLSFYCRLGVVFFLLFFSVFPSYQPLLLHLIRLAKGYIFASAGRFLKAACNFDGVSLIFSGISKSAGQETEPRLKKGKSPHQNQEHRVKRVDHRKPAIGDITVRASPVSTKQSSPRKIPLPSIPVQLHSNAYFRNGQLEVEVTCDERMYSSKEPMEVKVTFVHRHLQQKRVTKASAYKAKPARNPDRSLNSLTHPVNRNIIHQRALWPPFNTHLDTEASNRHKKIFGSL